MDNKVRIRRVIAFILFYVGTFTVGVLLHEAGHLITNNALGGTGNIYFHYSLMAGHMDWAILPEKLVWLVYLGGGLFAAAHLSLFFWLAAKITPSKQDVYVQAVAASQILANLLYAPTEVIFYYTNVEMFQWMSLVAHLMAAIIFFVLYIKKLRKWVDRLA